MKKIMSVLGALTIGACGIIFLAGELPFGGSTINDSRTDISGIQFISAITVGNGANITAAEATTIKNQATQVIDTKMNELGYEKGVDYNIDGLDSINAGVNLKSVDIDALSMASSTKIRGRALLFWQLTEDMSKWNVRAINVVEKDGLSELGASLLLTEIKNVAENEANEVQKNTEGVDYEIQGINLIVVGAIFDDYKNSIIISSLSTGRLIGSCKMNFN